MMFVTQSHPTAVVPVIIATLVAVPMVANKTSKASRTVISLLAIIGIVSILGFVLLYEGRGTETKDNAEGAIPSVAPSVPGPPRMIATETSPVRESYQGPAKDSSSNGVPNAYENTPTPMETLTPTDMRTANHTPTATDTYQENGATTMITAFPPSPLLQSQSVLYVRVEYHQAQLGLSVVLGGGQFRPLTTIYEWWIDAQNLGRNRRVTSELLEDGPHIVAADGSDGATGWWIVDWTKGMTVPERHEGKSPYVASSFQEFVGLFSNEGQRLIEASNRGEVERVVQTEHEFWGTLLTVRWSDPRSGNLTTATIRVEVPNILVERVIDREGKLFASDRITDWQWLDQTQLKADFWMNPPKDVPVGPGDLKP
jgi:hypothetical protein